MQKVMKKHFKYRVGKVFLSLCLVLIYGSLAISNINIFETGRGKPTLAGMADQAWTEMMPQSLDPQSFKVFASSMFETIDLAKPNFPIPPSQLREYGSSGKIETGSQANYQGPALTEKYLSKSVLVDQRVLEDLRKSHSFVVSRLPTKLPKSFYRGDGIIFVGGGIYSWLSLLSIRSLRNTGSVLPVEVIIPTRKEYEFSYCEEVLPRYNARCVQIPEVLGDDLTSSLQFDGYQLKSLALLVSSFENVLLLDSDNIPIRNPDPVFKSKVFRKYGMIIWPDYWRRTTHPGYYYVAGINLGDERVRFGPDHISRKDRLPQVEMGKLPLHDRLGSLPNPSSESGQMFLRKSTHHQAMWLSLYYNSYGPSSYYPLFSQSTAGEGDKETFIAAANYLNQTFYQVNKGPQVIGHHGKGSYHGVGMVQHDPMQDYKNQLEYVKRETTKQPYDPEKFDTTFSVENSRSMFLHANYPKLDPTELLFSDYLFTRLDKRVRMFGAQDSLDFDFELAQWINIKQLVCVERIKMEFFTDKAGVNVEGFRMEVCERIENQLEWLQHEGMDQLEMAKSKERV